MLTPIATHSLRRSLIVDSLRREGHIPLLLELRGILRLGIVPIFGSSSWSSSIGDKSVYYGQYQLNLKVFGFNRSVRRLIIICIYQQYQNWVLIALNQRKTTFLQLIVRGWEKWGKRVMIWRKQKRRGYAVLTVGSSICLQPQRRWKRG